MTNIGLVLDSPKRDLRGVVLTAYQLLKRGARVFILPMYQQGYDAPLLDLDVLLVNYARLNNQALLEGYRSLGTHICVLDTEGGVLSEAGLNSPPNWARMFGESGLSALIDHYFFWGARVHGAFVAGSGIPAARLSVSGCPRYDLCAAPWRSLLEYPRQGYVLVNANFSANNPAFTRSAKAEIEVFKKVGWDEDYTRALFAELERVFPLYIEAIAELARRNPDRKFIVRPHPFENGQVYQDRYAGLPNVVVDGAGDVLNVIANADCVVHLNCGTAVETLLLDKVPIVMDYLNSDFLRRHSPLPGRLSHAARSFEELNQLVVDHEARERLLDRPRLMEEHIRPWFGAVDGSAAQRVADGLLGSAGNAPTRSPHRSIAASLRGGRKNPTAMQRLQGLAGNTFGSLASARLREHAAPKRREKVVTTETVSDLVRRFAACEGVRVHAEVRHARHPWTGAPLSSIMLSPR